MATLSDYRAAVKTLIERYAAFLSADKSVETQIIMDEKRDHYQLVHIGWENERRVYGCVMHLDIRNDRIWIQHNNTEFDIDDDLLELGVARDDIVLGFRLPSPEILASHAV